MTAVSVLVEVSFSYVNNMKYTFTNISCDGDESSFDVLYASSDTTVDAAATSLTIDSWRLGSDAWHSFDAEWLPFNILVIGAMGQEEMTVTAVQDGTLLTVDRPNPINFVWSGPAVCLQCEQLPNFGRRLDDGLDVRSCHVLGQRRVRLRVWCI